MNGGEGDDDGGGGGGGCGGGGDVDNYDSDVFSFMGPKTMNLSGCPATHASEKKLQMPEI